MSWIEEEFGAFDAGDQRRRKRLLQLVTGWWTRVSGSVAQVCCGWAEQMAAYRLLKCSRVTLAAVLHPHQACLLARARAEAVVLDIQDTTVLDYTNRPIARTPGAVGPLTYENQRGLLAHVRLVVTPERLPLGVADLTLLTRPQLEGTTRTRSHKRRALKDKESVRWLAGYQGACALAEEAPTTQVISIADREGDLYEIYTEAATAAAGQERQAEWIVRSCQDRAVVLGERGSNQPLRLHLGLTPPCGWATVTVPARHGQAARDAACRVSVARVTLRPPYRSGVRLPPVEVTVVSVREYDPPADAARVEWVLLTSLPATTLEEVLLILHYYACRWEIEVFFRVFKSGCQVETSQIRTRAHLEPWLGICLVLAWRIRYLQRLGELSPHLPCTVAFAEWEWHVIARLATRQPPPATPPELATVLRWVALLGGFSGRKADGPPGALTIWRGLQRIQEALNLYCQLQQEVKCV